MPPPHGAAAPTLPTPEPPIGRPEGPSGDDGLRELAQPSVSCHSLDADACGDSSALEDGGAKESVPAFSDAAARWSVIAFVPTATCLSLMPVLIPFADPYDVSVDGYLKNAGYFLWYCGIGWSFLWAVHVAWYLHFLHLLRQIAALRRGVAWTTGGGSTLAILGSGGGRPFLVEMVATLCSLNRRPSVWVPTVFAMLLFFVAYVLLGGPFPLGTLVLGIPCFLVSWWSLWRFEGANAQALGRHPCTSEEHLAIQRQLAVVLIFFFALLVFNLVGYFLLQCLISYHPGLDDFMAIAFVFAGDLIALLDPYKHLLQIVGEPTSEPRRPAAGSAAGSGDDAPPAHTKRQSSSRREVGELLVKKEVELAALCSLFKTFFYQGLHLTYNSFLLPVISESVRPVLLGAFISALKSCITNHDMLRLNSDVVLIVEKMGSDMHHDDIEEQMRLCVDGMSAGLAARMFEQLVRLLLEMVVPITFLVMLCFNHYSWNKGMFFVLSELEDQDLENVCQKITINFVAAVVNFAAFCLMLRRWSRRAAQTGPLRAVVHDGETATGVLYQLAMTKLRREVSMVCFTRSAPSEVFFVVLFSQAAITTVVGVCMLMKHDGMDATGVVEWMVDGKAFPWRLSPPWQ